MADIFELFKKISKENSTSPSPVTHLVIGLGNPGDKYYLTRHNAGFLMMDYVSQRLGVKIDRSKFKALTSEATIGDKRVLLMKPQTFMNSSGEAIGEAAAFYKIPARNIIVLHDEISFEPGKIRIRRKGSDGGHNGLKSIIARLSGEDFPRIKIGVGQKPAPDYDLVAWVLGKIPKEDVEKIEGQFDNIASSVELIVSGNIDDAMNKYSK